MVIRMANTVIAIINSINVKPSCRRTLFIFVHRGVRSHWNRGSSERVRRMSSASTHPSPKLRITLSQSYLLIIICHGKI